MGIPLERHHGSSKCQKYWLDYLWRTDVLSEAFVSPNVAAQAWQFNLLCTVAQVQKQVCLKHTNNIIAAQHVQLQHLILSQVFLKLRVLKCIPHHAPGWLDRTFTSHIYATPGTGQFKHNYIESGMGSHHTDALHTHTHTCANKELHVYKHTCQQTSSTRPDQPARILAWPHALRSIVTSSPWERYHGIVTPPLTSTCPWGSMQHSYFCKGQAGLLAHTCAHKKMKLNVQTKNSLAPSNSSSLKATRMQGARTSKRKSSHCRGSHQHLTCQVQEPAKWRTFGPQVSESSYQDQLQSVSRRTGQLSASLHQQRHLTFPFPCP